MIVLAVVALVGFGVSLLLPTNPLKAADAQVAAVAAAGALDARA